MNRSIRRLDLNEIHGCIEGAVTTASSDVDIGRKVSSCIEDLILKQLNTANHLSYQHVARGIPYRYTIISGNKADALYGHVIVGYGRPSSLSSHAGVSRARDWLIKYISNRASSKAEWDRYLGVIISDRMAFVRYDKDNDRWLLRGPYSIKREAVVKLVGAIRGLMRKPLRADKLVTDFGRGSEIARRTVSLFYERLLRPRSGLTKPLFLRWWLELFGWASGQGSVKPSGLRELGKRYGIKGGVTLDALILAIQTYYALIVKLLASEAVYTYAQDGPYASYLIELDEAYKNGGVDALRKALWRLESGDLFRGLGKIDNFIGADYFSWYIYELDEEMADAIVKIARGLHSYEIATPQLEPELTVDLLKHLYQNLIPGKVRHSLGEYYTPDWLADLLLDEVGLSSEKLKELGKEDPVRPLEIRVLDPACGSGTLLVRYISRLRAYAADRSLEDILLGYLINNVMGYDLNPIAVLTAKANYLLMIIDLERKEPIEIPIYRVDSLAASLEHDLSDEAVNTLKSAVANFEAPVDMVEKGLLISALGEISSALEGRYDTHVFIDRVRSRLRGLSESRIDTLAKLYEKPSKLGTKDKNVLCSFTLRGGLAPLQKGRFDYVIGNPPWISWENLSDDYRRGLRKLWERYWLTEIKGRGLGKVKRDLAALFTVRCYDLYLKPGGRQGFIVPLTMFKNQSGRGFRRFLLERARIIAIHDLSGLSPFEEAANMTSMIVIEKPQETDGGARAYASGGIKDGIKNFIWAKRYGRPLAADRPLDEILKFTERFEARIFPVAPDDPASPWMQVTSGSLKAIRKVLGQSDYKAHEGVNAALNQAYFIKVHDKASSGTLVVTNPPEARQRKEVAQTRATIEPGVVYPLIRGRDVRRWHVRLGEGYIIVPHEPETGKPLSEDVLKQRYPNAYAYLCKYKKELENRSIHRLWGRGRPFYSLYSIGPYTFAPYKVVWREITSRSLGFACAVAGPSPEGRPVIPDHKLMLIPCDSDDEAYYIAGVLNSTIVRTAIAVYGIKTQLSTHILETVRLPKFNSSDSVSLTISRYSKRAHEVARGIYEGRAGNGCDESQLRWIEDELDRAVAELYELGPDELIEIKKLGRLLDK